MFHSNYILRMKKCFLLLLSVVSLMMGYAQNKPAATKKNPAKTDAVTKDTAKQFVNIPAANTTPSTKQDWSKINFANRANDHIMVQYGFDQWLNTPSWITTKGFSRHFNFYLMLDKPFKSNPHFSGAYGIGLTTDHMFFNGQNVDISGGTNGQVDSVQFLGSSASHFKKLKMTTIYLTIPVELRYFSDPVNPNNSYKFAIGAKVGLLLNAYTKGKDLLDGSGNSVMGSSYIQKDYSSKFFNSYLFSTTARIGWGNFSINADYGILTVFKDGSGPGVHPLSIGLTISGL